VSASPSLVGAPSVDDWLEVLGDDEVLVHSGKVEIGQHIGHALKLIVAEELDIPLSSVRIATADTDRSPDEGYTSGSNSLQHSGEAIRLASATARRELVERAAHHFGVTAPQVSCAGGMLRNKSSNEVLSFTQAMANRPFNVPVDTNIATVRAADLTVVGQPSRLSSLVETVTGSAQFVHDLAWPKMLHARVIRPPNYHATLCQPPDSNAVQLRDMKVVCDGSFVAVAGALEYDVVRGARHLERSLVWDTSTALDTSDVFERLYSAPRQSRTLIDGTPVDGPVVPHPKSPPQAASVLSARFERAYQMHGSIGPSAAAACYNDGTLQLWSATQGVFPLRGAIAETLGLSESDVRVVHVPGAGCYGHNGADDATLDAALVARENPGIHVLLKWTREQEHTWEPYAPCMGVELRAALDTSATVIQWCQDSYGDTHRARPRPGSGKAGPARLLAARHLADAAPAYIATPNMARHAGNHRNADPIYAFKQRSIIKHLVPGLALRTSAMRTLGAFANIFAIESFMDELADAGDVDPLTFRLRHLRDARARAVLTQVATTAGWPGENLASDEALGLGMAQYKNAQAYVAVCARVSVTEAAEVRLRHAYIVADAGRVVDREGLVSQIEGGFIQAASWALFEAVEHDDAGILSRDWESYRIARFNDLPTIETELIDRPEQPSVGAGEASSGPAGAAIANAIARASGVRPRRIPFTPDNLRRAAMDD
jgi:nicotinate dehydrogenase subunit B